MNHPKIVFLFVLLLLSTSLRGQSADPWAIKKQRKNTGQQPTFHYQTRNGAKAAARYKNHRAASPLAKQLIIASQFKLKGPTNEPPHEI
jgi:hypothetical protein